MVNNMPPSEVERLIKALRERLQKMEPVYPKGHFSAAMTALERLSAECDPIFIAGFVYRYCLDRDVPLGRAAALLQASVVEAFGCLPSVHAEELFRQVQVAQGLGPLLDDPPGEPAKVFRKSSKPEKFGSVGVYSSAVARVGGNVLSEDRIVRDEKRARLTGLSRSAWWEGEKAGKYPKRRRLGPASVGWLLSELQEWMRSLEATGANAPANALSVRGVRGDRGKGSHGD